jgi:flavin-dependent dehydrogenase
MANEQNLKPFEPNQEDGKKDPRINRGGRPKSFDAARKLAQAKMNEPAIGPDGKTMVKNGKVVTNAEMFFEAWMKSKDRKSFAEFAYGKVKEEVDITSGGKVIKVTLTDE